MKTVFRGLSLVLALCLAVSIPVMAGAGDGYQKRVDFGRRLEPRGDRILLGAGQDPLSFWTFSLAIGKAPAISMGYVGLNEDPSGFFDNLKVALGEYGETVMPQIGLCMTHDGVPSEHYEHLVARGDYDENLVAFLKGLKGLGRPAFVRIGYEFNGPWNGYEPESYKAAFRRVVDTARKLGVRNVAWVWNYHPGDWGNEYMDYYPGDGYVDWWSLDIFDINLLDHPDTREFMDRAKEHGFPVMIGESTPQRVGVLDGQASWDAWFRGYFDFIRVNPTIKAVCYINWRWEKYSPLSDWGDARLEANPVVRINFRKEVTLPRYIHGTSLQSLRKLLVMDK